MDDNTFYDIHMHAFNLSHPYLRPFIQRFKIDQLLLLTSILSILTYVPILRSVTLSIIDRMLNKAKNLLSVMENDIGSFFLVTENCLREFGNPLLKDDGLYLGGKKYTRIVLTPLMIDFGYKDLKDKNIHYSAPSKKPIVEQVRDVFNGIKKYRDSSADQVSEIYPFLSSNTERIFEIYPFLGINTRNYDIGRIEQMLDKYFGSYDGSQSNFSSNMGKFDGDIEHLGSNVFAGIKIYPPLGFDPWPDSGKKKNYQNDLELLKVIYLYQYCSDKGIPITAHGSEGGFVVVENKQDLKNFCSVSKWARVLEEYPQLKLNLAHFPMKEKFLKVFPNPGRPRLKAMLRLILKYDNVYVDFSNRAVNDKYYRSLRKLIDKLDGEEKTKLKNRILFGSDYTINLMSIESYNKYLDIYSQSTSLTSEEKEIFCSANPGRFLFSRAK